MKNYGAYLMGFLYVMAGINHFVNPAFYLKMMPDVFPFPAALVIVSGVAEIVLGIGVCFPATRKMAAWGIIVLLIAVFPANINMALHPEQWSLNPLGLYLRLPLQLVLIWWAYVYTR